MGLGQPACQAGAAPVMSAMPCRSFRSATDDVAQDEKDPTKQNMVTSSMPARAFWNTSSRLIWSCHSISLTAIGKT
jgi:hypothetical protein